MSTELFTIVAVLVFGAIVWWRYKAGAQRRHAEAESELERHDHARAYEMAKIQADLSRWSGPH